MTLTSMPKLCTSVRSAVRVVKDRQTDDVKTITPDTWGVKILHMPGTIFTPHLSVTGVLVWTLCACESLCVTTLAGEQIGQMNGKEVKQKDI